MQISSRCLTLLEKKLNKEGGEGSGGGRKARKKGEGSMGERGGEGRGRGREAWEKGRRGAVDTSLGFPFRKNKTLQKFSNLNENRQMFLS